MLLLIALLANIRMKYNLNIMSLSIIIWYQTGLTTSSFFNTQPHADDIRSTQEWLFQAILWWPINGQKPSAWKNEKITSVRRSASSIPLQKLYLSAKCGGCSRFKMRRYKTLSKTVKISWNFHQRAKISNGQVLLLVTKEFCHQWVLPQVADND